MNPKKLLKTKFPNLVTLLKNLQLNKILKSNPQISQNNKLKFWGSMRFDKYEQKIVNFLIQRAKNSQIFINVGANSGIYCLKLAKYFNLVYAFEPLKQNLKLLFKNVKENKLSKKIIIFPVVAGSKECLVSLYGASTSGSLLPGWNNQFDRGETLQQFSIDYLISDKVKGKKLLCLIDVEGAELEVLKGLQKIIKSCTAEFCVEIPCREFMPNEKFNQNIKLVFNLFKKYRYFSWEILNNGELKVLSKKEIHQYTVSKRFHGLMAFFSRDPNTSTKKNNFLKHKK